MSTPPPSGSQMSVAEIPPEKLPRFTAELSLRTCKNSAGIEALEKGLGDINHRLEQCAIGVRLAKEEFSKEFGSFKSDVASQTLVFSNQMGSQAGWLKVFTWLSGGIFAAALMIVGKLYF